VVELEHIGDGDHQIEELGFKTAALIGQGFEFLGQLQQLELRQPVPLLKGAAAGAGGWAPLAEEGQQSCEQVGEVLESQGSMSKALKGSGAQSAGLAAVQPEGQGHP
jgi:hypothetical protein